MSLFYFIYFCLAENGLGQRAKIFIQIIATVLQLEFPIVLCVFVVCDRKAVWSMLLFKVF
jgi:hypothetical protein